MTYNFHDSKVKQRCEVSIYSQFTDLTGVPKEFLLGWSKTCHPDQRVLLCIHQYSIEPTVVSHQTTYLAKVGPSVEFCVRFIAKIVRRIDRQTVLLIKIDHFYKTIENLKYIFP